MCTHTSLCRYAYAAHTKRIFQGISEGQEKAGRAAGTDLPFHAPEEPPPEAAGGGRAPDPPADGVAPREGPRLLRSPALQSILAHLAQVQKEPTDIFCLLWPPGGCSALSSSSLTSRVDLCSHCFSSVVANSQVFVSATGCGGHLPLRGCWRMAWEASARSPSTVAEAAVSSQCRDNQLLYHLGKTPHLFGCKLTHCWG